jgi:NAD(P)-dependent dehydrogenase (short-subunit alcohol dehydrogenase family)
MGIPGSTGKQVPCRYRHSERPDPARSKGENRCTSNPARRIGTPEDIAQGVLFALTNTFLTGQTLHVDGGEPFT